MGWGRGEEGESGERRGGRMGEGSQGKKRKGRQQLGKGWVGGRVRMGNERGKKAEGKGRREH